MHTIDQILLFSLLGLGTGALIAGIGLGVVLSYRGSGVINLARARTRWSPATSSTRCATIWPSPLPRASCLALGATIALGVLVELVVFRRLRTSSPLSKLVASLGVLLIARAASPSSTGGGGRIVRSVLPDGR